mmetsp:Transcript_8365/g.25827  ORF Transcript_8365/g.25827 Transcript_8365/m.25827 type:complete len:256 (+) Transcript_8365:1535-2302(+)
MDSSALSRSSSSSVPSPEERAQAASAGSASARCAPKREPTARTMAPTSSTRVPAAAAALPGAKSRSASPTISASAAGGRCAASTAMQPAARLRTGAREASSSGMSAPRVLSSSLSMPAPKRSSSACSTSRHSISALAPSPESATAVHSGASIALGAAPGLPAGSSVSTVLSAMAHASERCSLPLTSPSHSPLAIEVAVVSEPVRTSGPRHLTASADTSPLASSRRSITAVATLRSTDASSPLALESSDSRSLTAM